MASAGPRTTPETGSSGRVRVTVVSFQCESLLPKKTGAPTEPPGLASVLVWPVNQTNHARDHSLPGHAPSIKALQQSVAAIALMAPTAAWHRLSGGWPRRVALLALFVATRKPSAWSESGAAFARRVAQPFRSHPCGSEGGASSTSMKGKPWAYRRHRFDHAQERVPRYQSGHAELHRRRSSIPAAASRPGRDVVQQRFHGVVAALAAQQQATAWAARASCSSATLPSKERRQRPATDGLSSLRGRTLHFFGIGLERT